METLRTSSYLIPVKLEHEEGKYMLVHGYTGAIDIVSETMLEKIKSVSSKPELSPEMMNLLFKRGYITNKTQEEEYAYVARIAKALHRKTEILNTSFTWVVTYNCNFRCPYCFEYRENKDQKYQIVFTKDMVDKAYQVMEQIQPQKELQQKVITLYGGEPLLAENKEIVTYIVKEGRKRGYQFKAITNGYDLNLYLDLLSPCDIRALQITIDGPKDFHNERRIHYQYHDTFDRIIENISLALKQEVQIDIRINTDYSNIEKLSELKEYFSKIGFDNYPNFKFYSALLKDNSSITDMERSKLNFQPAQAYITKLKQNDSLSLCQDYGIYQLINEAIKNKRPIAFRSVYCSSQAGEFVLDPLGRIYPCWEVVGREDFIIGSFKDSNIKWNKPILHKWRNMDILESDSCRICRYALLCGGGCPFHSIMQGKKQCSFFRQFFTNAVNRAYLGFKSN